MVKHTIAIILCSIFLAFCPSSLADDPVKLHVFLHSHMDEGWIYTFENYYTGTNSQEGGCVRCVFNNVYNSLLQNAERKYQVAEVAFVNRWWSEQDSAHKEQFKKFVAQKQIQFINGGWSANDEACAYYEDIIDQFIYGHRWLKRELDIDPDVAWQIDSFGHSATQAALMAQAGYQGFFFGRIDYQDWDKRRADKTLEVNWKPQNPRNESVFAHVNYVHYSDTKFMIPDNFYCRSIFCYGDLDQSRLNQVGDWIRQQSNSFRTKNVAMLVGDDFHLWQDAEKDFRGIEAMINYFNSNPSQGIQAKFSALPEYVEEFKADFKASGQPPLPDKHGDFFPYIENAWTSWVGYFTSKSMFKLRVRQISQYYNAVKLLFAKFMLGGDQTMTNLDTLSHQNVDKVLCSIEDPLGVVQHHDAISGTMKEYVKEDYENMLNTAKSNVENAVINVLNAYSEKLIGSSAGTYNQIDFDWRENDPALVDLFTQGKSVLVNVFNPGEKDKFLIKIRTPNYQFKVKDDQNNYIVVDIICNNDNAKEDCFVYFVDEIPAYSLKNYIISPSILSKRVVPEDIQAEMKLNIMNQVTLTVNSNLQNFYYQLCPDIDPNDLRYLFVEKKCIEDNFSLNYEYYQSWTGSGLQVSSGAYIFRPRANNRQEFSRTKSGRVFKGRHVTVVQIFRDNVRTDLKLVHHELDKGIEIESYLGPVNDAWDGKEIVIMLRSQNVLNHDLEFFTDSNGYYMQKRKINHRDDFEQSTPDIPIPSNYYPITSAIYIESDSDQRLTVVTDRAQGATSFRPGEVEIMIHRITVQDDWKGLSEVLNEKDQHGPIRVSTRHYLMYSSPELGFKHNQRRKQYKLDRPLQFWFKTVLNEHIFNEKLSAENSNSLNLPESVKLSIRSYNPGEYIVRLHNLDEESSKKVKIYDLETRLCSLLNDFAARNDILVDSVTELSLFTTKKRSEVKLNDLDPTLSSPIVFNDDKELSAIELLPMEIRTFSIVIKQ